MSQKAKICGAINGYIKEKGLKFDGKVDLNSSQRADVVAILVEMFKAGAVEIRSDKERGNPKKYFGGAVSNYLRKDPQYNMGNPYKPNPDKLKGPRKPENIKELEKLLAMVKAGGDEAVIKQVAAELEAANKKHAESKAKTESINADVIPAHLRKFIK
jgi:hypothetical protein